MLRFSWIAEVGEFSFAFQNNCRQILDWMVLKGISINKGAYNIAARISTCEKKMFYLEGSLVLWLMTHADFEWFWHNKELQLTTMNKEMPIDNQILQSLESVCPGCITGTAYSPFYPFLNLHLGGYSCFCWSKWTWECRGDVPKAIH